jgi:hypothetical protein
MAMTIRNCDKCGKDYRYDDRDRNKYASICQECFEKQEKEEEFELSKIEKKKKVERFIKVYAPVIMDIENSVFCKEVCFLCKKLFEADMTLFELKNFGYICYECAGKLELKEVPSAKEIEKRQDKRLADMFGKDYKKRHGLTKSRRFKKK